MATKTTAAAGAAPAWAPGQNVYSEKGSAGGGPDTLSPGVVDKVGAHHVHVTHGTRHHPYSVRYRVSDGREVGGDRYFPARLLPRTPERDAAYADQSARAAAFRVILSTKWRELPTATLQRVAAALGAGVAP